MRIVLHEYILEPRQPNTTRFLRIDGFLFHTCENQRNVEIEMSDDLFLKIINREIPADIVYETDDVLAFRDINPQAPYHVLIIPKERIPTINDLDTGQAKLVGKLFLAAAELANREGIAEEGYRVVMNCNEAGGQAVYHIHLHLLGGRQMGWPPG
jgi:histidine triad (HIT) family protein